ncbi:MAG: hypothetical protein ACFFE8_10060, partial [Candidatus Heimdallarchaeota archaeon]
MTAIGFFLLLVVMSSSTATITAQAPTSSMWASEYTHHGGYVDELWWRVYGSGETAQAMLALESGEIDAHS